ncbi:MAG: hypothetical protein ABFR65_14065, partial [Pseudomonadota bacterium]
MTKYLKTMLFGAVLVFTLGLLGCRTAPVYNVEQSPIDVSAQATLKDIKKSIMQSGVGLGWQMKETEPGLITGTLYLRDH